MMKTKLGSQVLADYKCDQMNFWNCSSSLRTITGTHAQSHSSISI